MEREQVRLAIIMILQDAPRPLKAKEVRAAYCRHTGQWSVTSKQINSILHSELRTVAQQDSEFRWTIREGNSTVARYRRRNDYGRKRALQHIEEARRLSELLGGTDVDVKEYFFQLPKDEVDAVLDEYGRRYGQSKREYAESVFPLWKNGRRKMSGLVAERLFNLLPPRMPLGTKYEMVRTLWEKYSPSSDASYVVGPDCDPTAVTQEIERQLHENVTHYKIPEPLENRFAWLSAGDVAIRQELLNHFLDEEGRLIAADAGKRAQIILRHFEQKGQWTQSIRQEYKIGNHKLELFFDPRSEGFRKGRPECPAPTPRYESSGCLVMCVVVLATVITVMSSVGFALAGR